MPGRGFSKSDILQVHWVYSKFNLVPCVTLFRILTDLLPESDSIPGKQPHVPETNSMPQSQTPEFDYFISYADDDRAWAEGVLTDALRAAHFKCITHADFEAGKPLLQAFEDAVVSSRKVILVLSPAYLADQSARFSDLLAQHYGIELTTWPVVPLIYKQVEDLPLRLRMLNPVDATREQDWEAVIKGLTGQISPPRREIPGAPYPGLRAFSKLDQALFFGRETEIQDMLRLLRAYPFLALIGSSGSGKSSLMYAGLLPALKESQAFGSGDWLMRELRPGADPLPALATVLAGDPLAPSETIPGLLRQHNAERLLVMVDQFEELFTVTNENALAFQNALLGLIKQDKVWVVITARADFYPSLMSSLLWSEIRTNRYELLPLTESALAEAIRKPAERVGVYIESALVERLVGDAREEPGVLPFVQETMILLWDKVVRRFLPLSAYEALVLPRSAYDKYEPEGTTGLDAAIAIHAKGVLGRLNPEQQDAARRIFLRLVSFGDGRPDTRRQQPRSALQLNYDPQLIDSTIAYLANEKARLLTISGQEGDPDPKIDISHEALITAPSAIRIWIEDGRVDELLRRNLQEAAAEWLNAKRDGSYLYESARLQQARDWSAHYHEDISPEIQSFLDASVQSDNRRKMQRRSFILLTGLFALFGLASAFYFARLEGLKQAARGPMVYFPKGLAVLGYGQTRVERELDAFYLEKYEVTNGQYELCVDAARCTPANRPYEEGKTEPGPNLPVTWVTAYQAATFCDWIGRRLPTVTEWERAARGVEGRTWPWREDSPIDPRPRVHIFLSDWLEAKALTGPVAVNDPAYELGVTPDGIWHVLGNVAEWTATFGSLSTCPDPYAEACQIWDGKSTEVQALTVVGLGWSDDLSSDQMDRVSEYYYASLVSDDQAIGFRCADSP